MKASLDYQALPEQTPVPSSSGVVLAAYDLGQADGSLTSDRNLLFAHATGFCAGVWAPLTAHLGEYRKVSLDFRGHGLSSVAAHGMDWAGTAEDVLAVIDAFEIEKPFGIGQSMGGASLILAEQMRPGTFSGLWVYEPIIFPTGESSTVPEGLDIDDLSEKNPLVVSALRRRSRFASPGEAEKNFASKPPLSDLCATALHAYVEYGFEQLPDGSISLRCQPEVEADTYRMGARHDAFAHLGEVTCPVTVARGHSQFPGPADLAPLIAQALPSATLQEFPSLGHFGPLQDPSLIATAVKSAVAAVAAAT